MPAELRFDAMGTSGLIAVRGDAGLLVHARERIEDLEAKWSRFRNDSELTRLLATAGRATLVSTDTLRLVASAMAGCERTGGRYDPTVLDAMIANGYDRTFTDLGADDVTGHARGAPGCHGIEIDNVMQTVSLPVGVGLDPGGIGKGLAADIVVEELMARGVEGALVDIGGDIRCAGAGPNGDGWVVDTADPFGPEVRLHLTLRDAAIATSSTLRRRWGPQRSMHHIVDPRSGRPADSGVVAATVIARDAWWAEVVATTLIVDGDLSAVHDAHALVTRSDGSSDGSAELLELVA